MKKIKIICINKKCENKFETAVNKHGYPQYYYCKGFCRDNTRYGSVSYGLL